MLRGRTTVDKVRGDGVEWVLMVVFDGSNREKKKGVFVVQRAARAARE